MLQGNGGCFFIIIAVSELLTFDPLLKFTSLVTFERKRGAVKERSNLCFRLVFAHSIKFIAAHCDLNLFFQIAKWESLEVEY